MTIEHPDSIAGLESEINALYASTLAQSRVDYGNFGPVHPDYERPFAFPGTIRHVTFTLPDARPPTQPELEDTARTELTRQ